MKGPYNCSKLFGTLCRPKAVTLSSYNILIQEKHRNMCVVIGTWGGGMWWQGNIHYFSVSLQSISDMDNTLNYFHGLN